MDRYTLTKGGRWRFMRIKAEKEPSKMEGYEILDYLYEKGPRTVEEIADYTGLSRSRVTGRLLAFMPQEYIEKVADLYFFA